MATILSLSVLGPFTLVIEGRPVEKLPRKGQALLALLAIRRGRPLTRDKAADLLWSRSGPVQARNSLRQLLLVLRRELGRDIIRAERDPLSMDIGSVAVDAVAFEDDAGAADLDRL